jgi:translation initiation factor IF-2
MTNIRVYELSRDIDKPSKEIVKIAKGLGISVKSHASSISAEEAKKIIDKIGAQSSNEPQAQKTPSEEMEKVRVFRSESGEEVVERRKGSRVVLRRKKKVIEPEAEKIDIAPVPDTPDTMEGLEQIEAKVQQEDVAHETQAQEDNQKQNVDLADKTEFVQEVTEEFKDESLDIKEIKSDSVEHIKDKTEKEAQDETAKKFKKKGKKVKPKRDQQLPGD